jgi:hypothetical protein
MEGSIRALFFVTSFALPRIEDTREMVEEEGDSSHVTLHIPFPQSWVSPVSAQAANEAENKGRWPL